MNRMSPGFWPKPKSTTGDPNDETGTIPDATPIGPETTPSRRLNLFKWILFLAVLVYVALSYFHAPILTQMGKYLVLQHPVERSDLLVCLAGSDVERGLASGDLFARGLAPKVFISRETIPDGLETLRQRGIPYPESIDRVGMILKGSGVPESALIRNDRPTESTFHEAEAVAALMREKRYRSLILVTSPTHSRRAWLTFRRAIPDKEVRMAVMPTPYSQFRAEDWWKTRRYVREVILEYQKLIYYKAKGLL